MGIVFSHVDYCIEVQKDDTVPDSLVLSVSSQALRLSVERMRFVVARYLKYKLSAILDCISLHGFLQSCDQTIGLSPLNCDYVYVLWKIHSKNSICYLHDILIFLILLCDGSWYERLSLLFDIFKSAGSDEVSYEDVLMMLQISALTLHRLWESSVEWKQSEVNQLTESLADELYAKLGKELDSGVNKEEFLNWSQERFKASRSIASFESLVKILKSQFEV